MNIHYKRIHHVQICIDHGLEDKAREFYTDILQMKEIAKPDSLIANGGLWYKVGDIELHIGTESNKTESKRHPAFEVQNLKQIKNYFIEKGIKINEEKPIPNMDRFSFRDPFGNRIEFLEMQ
ncbi:MULTISPECIES: VOC family protein [Bacillus]|uniref:VOC family protein n=1 Tax=Bacillus TaxID=1386 RepID=UPI000BB69F56|nr:MULTISPECIES: VOC family protein [Bacillus]